MVCTYLIELVAGIMTGYIFIYLDDAIVMRFALSMLYIPAVLVLVDAKSKAVRFLVYLILILLFPAVSLCSLELGCCKAAFFITAFA